MYGFWVEQPVTAVLKYNKMDEGNASSGCTSSGSNHNNVFNRIDKFNGKDTDLASWIRTFDHACTIANKTDDLVRGQWLMLCLTGQALAVGEQLEEETKAQQPYTALKARLESVFNTTASREAKMVEFENRIQGISESEDEFMLSLVKLYKAANPDAADPATTLAIKRKFMNGISQELRRCTYIFCKEPFDAGVTYQDLLEAARKARLQMSDQSLDQSQSLQVANVSSSHNYSGHNYSGHNLEDMNSLSQRLEMLESRLNDQQPNINAIDDQYTGSQSGNDNRFHNDDNYFYNNNSHRGNHRGKHRGNQFHRNVRSNNRGGYLSRGTNSSGGHNSFRGNYSGRGRRSFRGGRGLNNNNANRGRNRRSPLVCHKCRELNHYASDCQSLN